MRNITALTIVCTLLISIVSCTKTSRIEELVKQFSMAVLPDTLDFADCKAGDKVIDLKIHDYLLPAIDSISEMALGSAFSKLEGCNLYPVFYLGSKPDCYLLVYCQANPDRENESFTAIVTVSKRDEIIDRMIVSQAKVDETTSKEIKTFFLDSTNFIVQTIIDQNGERTNYRTEVQHR